MAAALDGIRLRVDAGAFGHLDRLQVAARPATARHTVRPHPSFRQALQARIGSVTPAPRPATEGLPLSPQRPASSAVAALSPPRSAPATATAPTLRPAPVVSRAATPPHVVRPGDTLGAIVGRALAAQGAPNDPAAVHAAVRAVARANGIDNPNRIHPGQTIDLGAIAAPPAAESDGGGRGGPVPGARRVGLSEWLGGEVPMRGDIADRVDRILAPKVGGASGADRVLGGAATLTSGYGMRRDPFSGERAFHAGVDFAADPGTPIHPFRDGVVVFSGWQRGYGRTVIVRHADGLESVYAHNRANLVRVGDTVTRDTQLGEVGSTGRSTGPHLHFEVRKHGRPVNPTPYLQATTIARAS